MNCRVSKSTLSGVLPCPPNKSYTHRAIFSASLAGRGSVVEGALISQDTQATIEACRALGAVLETDGSTVSVKRGTGASGNIRIDAANSGTTIRIAAAISGLYPATTTLVGDASLQSRPMQPLLDALESAGARCSSTSGRPPLVVSGSMTGGRVSVRGSVSSQFVSALMISAPLTPSGMDIRIDGDLVSKPYLDVTIATMRRFGATIQTILPYRSYVIPPQSYRPARFAVPIDFSSLALILSAAVLCGDGLSVAGRMDELPQGDEAFLDILELMGARVHVGEETISVSSPERLQGGSFDLGNSPDLLPPLAILSLKSAEPITITNVGHARLKETDRISAISRELRKLGVDVAERPDGMVLMPPRQTRGAGLDSSNDHRLFMAFCIAGMYVGDCTVSGAESADVSYPGFVRDMTGAGGKLSMAP